jgi:hypothetical protein
MGRVTALSPPRLQHTRIDQRVAYERQHARFRPMREQPAANVGQDGRSNAGVVKLACQRIVPVDAGTNGRCGRSGRHGIEMLEHEDQGEVRGRFGWAAPVARAVSEIGVGEDRAEGVAHGHGPIARGEGPLRRLDRSGGNDRLKRLITCHGGTSIS